jgi:diadenosine tetraphosphate (Ap4A) HIT family hydrolase
MTTSADCIFCAILAGRAPASIVYRDDMVCAFMDIRPVNPGHLLVIPIEHAVYLADLPPATGGRMFEVGQRLAAALRTSGVRCEGVNLFLADGAPAGQEIFHCHLHVVPRYAGDGFRLQHGPGFGKLSERAELDATASAIRQRLAG